MERQIKTLDIDPLNVVYAYRSEWATKDNPIDFLYYIKKNDETPNGPDKEIYGSLMFQDGVRGQEGTVDGMTENDLLEIVVDRLIAREKQLRANPHYNNVVRSAFVKRASDHVLEALYQLKLLKEKENEL